MEQQFDYRTYWIERYNQQLSPLKKSGISSLSEETNRHFYNLVKSQYNLLLRECQISLEDKNVLDAGAGIGQYIPFFLSRKAEVAAIDISEYAINHIRMKFPMVKAVVGSLENLDEYFYPGEFDFIHCFDVLYHIIDDEAWKKVIENFAKTAKKYIVLHGRFQNVKQIVTSKHIRWRSNEETVKELENHGFYEIGFIPTTMIRRLFTYRLLDFFPSLYYNVDKTLLNLNLARRIGGSFVKVFRRLP